jgi:hypothetical protein
MLALLAHPAGQHKRMGEDALEFSLALDLANDVARDPAEIGADRPQRPVGALELLGVGVALMGDQRVFADPLIGLAQAHASFLRQLRQPLARPMHELGVGRKSTALGCTVVSTMTMEKSAGFAAPVRAATDRLSWISATSFSSPIRWRHRVSDERLKVSLCWKNSSPQNN